MSHDNRNGPFNKDYCGGEASLERPLRKLDLSDPPLLLAGHTEDRVESGGPKELARDNSIRK
jgi:hypothetical protein